MIYNHCLLKFEKKEIVMKKLIVILIIACFKISGFSQTITYSFLPPVNNGNGTQTLTVTATASANIPSNSWSAGRMGFRFPLTATGMTAATYGQNWGANGNIADANFTNVNFNSGGPGGFSDPFAPPGISTILLGDFGGINDGYLYIGCNWAAPANSSMTGGVPINILSFRVPTSWMCTGCFEFTTLLNDNLGALLGAQFDLGIQHAGVSGGNTNIAVNGTNGSLGFSTLPVTFSNYDVKCTDKGVALTWATATEQNSSKFEIQRSENGIDWIIIDNVAAAGNSDAQRSYQYVDLKGGNAQYRIRQVDIDGRFVYTAIKRTDCKQSKLDVVLYPVPAKDNITLVIKSERATRTDLQILDMNGRVVRRVPTQINKGNTNVNLDVSALPAGQYMLSGSEPSLQINKKFTIVR
jgi:Secretion system C-terminal sorting domain